MKSFIKLDDQLAEVRRLLSQLAVSGRGSPPNLSRKSMLRICIADGAFVPHLSDPTMEIDVEFRRSGELSDLNMEALLSVYDREDDFDTWNTEKWLLREYSLVLRNRRGFVTDGLSVGLGPRAAREGDFIVVVNGSATPLVLRPLDDGHVGPSRFTFVGQCYLEGIIFGEKYSPDVSCLEFYTLI